MAKGRKGLVGAALAFAASPQGRRVIQQAKEYASKPENRQKAQQLVQQARSRRPGAKPGTTPDGTTGANPPYGTPPQH